MLDIRLVYTVHKYLKRNIDTCLIEDNQSVRDVYKTFKFSKLILISEINSEEFGLH